MAEQTEQTLQTLTSWVGVAADGMTKMGDAARKNAQIIRRLASTLRQVKRYVFQDGWRRKQRRRRPTYVRAGGVRK